MKLISTETARIFLGKPSGQPDINLQIGTAVELATVPIERLLLTSFQRRTVLDVFHIDSSSDRAKSAMPTRIKLSLGQVEQAGFVFSDASLDGDAFSVGDAFSGSHSVDYQKGIIIIPKNLYGWYAVNYTAGFLEEQTECGESVAAGVPGWLQDATLILTASIYQKLVAKKSTTGMDEKTQKYSAASLAAIPGGFGENLDQYIRWYPTAHDPEWSEF